MAKQLAVRVKEVCYVVRVLSNSEGADVELVVLGNVLQEVFGVRSDAGMVPRAPRRELEVVHILKTHIYYHTILAYNKRKKEPFYDMILLCKHNRHDSGKNFLCSLCLIITLTVFW